MRREMKAIEKRIEKGWSITSYQMGQLELFQGLYCLITKGSINEQKVRKAGEMLWVSGQHRDMVDALNIWTPQSVHRDIEYIWDGIGNWRA